MEMQCFLGRSIYLTLGSEAFLPAVQGRAARATQATSSLLDEGVKLLGTLSMNSIFFLMVACHCSLVSFDL